MCLGVCTLYNNFLSLTHTRIQTVCAFSCSKGTLLMCGYSATYSIQWRAQKPIKLELGELMFMVLVPMLNDLFSISGCHHCAASVAVL